MLKCLFGSVSQWTPKRSKMHLKSDRHTETHSKRRSCSSLVMVMPRRRNPMVQIKVEVKQLRASALAALYSAFKSTSDPKPSSASWPGGIGQGSQRAAAVAALSSVLTAETKKYPDVSPACPSRSPPAEASGRASLKSGDSAETEDFFVSIFHDIMHGKSLEVKETETSEPIIESNGGESGSKTDADQDDNASETSQSTFSYERLKAKSDDPVMGIDYKRREAYLSDGEFQSMFEMTKMHSTSCPNGSKTC